MRVLQSPTDFIIGLPGICILSVGQCGRTEHPEQSSSYELGALFVYSSYVTAALVPWIGGSLVLPAYLSKDDFAIKSSQGLPFQASRR